MTTVAVLGAGGFVGRHVVRELARRGHAVHAWTLELPPAHERGGEVSWRAVDLDAFEPRELEADVVVHLAEGSVLAGRADHDRNVERARRVLTAGFGRAIYASSAVVYGDASDEPHDEEAPTRGDSPYAAAKLAVEELFRHDSRSTIVRLTNVYGPGMARVNVLSEIIGQIGATGPIRVRDLAPVRDYLHVDDAARGFADLVDCPLGGVVNLGTSIGVSVADLARVVCRAAGTPDRELAATAPSDARSALVLDVQRAASELGWHPLLSIDQGVTPLVQEKLS